MRAGYVEPRKLKRFFLPGLVGGERNARMNLRRDGQYSSTRRAVHCPHLLLEAYLFSLPSISSGNLPFLEASYPATVFGHRSMQRTRRNRLTAARVIQVLRPTSRRSHTPLPSHRQVLCPLIQTSCAPMSRSHSARNCVQKIRECRKNNSPPGRRISRAQYAEMFLLVPRSRRNKLMAQPTVVRLRSYSAWLSQGFVENRVAYRCIRR